MTQKLSEKQAKLVEELGVLFERSGMQPAASRILALLNVSDRPELGFEEIYETLQISKSAASNGINLLLGTDRIEYTTQAGDRKRYFRAKMKTMKENVQKSLVELDVLNGILKKILDQRPADTKDFNESLKEVTEFLDFIKIELPQLLRKWEDRKQ